MNSENVLNHSRDSKHFYHESLNAGRDLSVGMEESSVVHLREMTDIFYFQCGECALEPTGGDGCADDEKALGNILLQSSKTADIWPVPPGN